MNKGLSRIYFLPILFLMLVFSACGQVFDYEEGELLGDDTSVLTTAASRGASSSEKRALRNLFRKVVIVGASISDDRTAPSPGRLLAVRAGVSNKRITKHAKSGQPSKYHLSWLESYLHVYRPTIIIGIDLFAKDIEGKFSVDGTDEYRVRRVVSLLCATADQVYIGNVPDLSPAAYSMNSYLRKLKRRYRNLYIVDVNTIFRKLWSFSGYHYTLNKEDIYLWGPMVFVDWVHPNRHGSKLMANVIIKMIHDNNKHINKRVLPFYRIGRRRR